LLKCWPCENGITSSRLPCRIRMGRSSVRTTASLSNGVEAEKRRNQKARHHGSDGLEGRLEDERGGLALGGQGAHDPRADGSAVQHDAVLVHVPSAGDQVVEPDVILRDPFLRR
jgi:hypothetical protein